MPSAAKKSAAYREGRADKSKKPSIEIEVSTEGEEEEEGPETEEMDGAKSPTNRKRSAKGAKNTKPPMDGGTYGKKPMDGEGCGCGGRKGKGKCDGNCGKKMDRNDALTPQEYLTACELGIQGRSRSYIRARLDAARRLDLKCGNGAISKGEKCTKGTATQTQGPSAAVRVGQGLKGAGLGALEAGKWLSGYNIGKTIASGVTQGQNQKANTGAKAASIIGSGLLLGPVGAIGAARRLGGFGSTDLQQHASNQKKERKWRKSVGYRDGTTYAKGFSVDFDQLAV